MGEPLVLQQQQEALHNTSNFEIPTTAERTADETKVPKADKIAVKKSIHTDKPSKLDVEVFNLNYNISLKYIYMYIN